jgi:hypothetical protein
LKFKVNADICFINNFTKHLNINAMEFFKFWLSHCCTLPKNSYITHSHLLDIVKNWSKKKGSHRTMFYIF